MCVDAMRELPGDGGMSSIRATAMTNRIALLVRGIEERAV
jgi:hypothetical protein